VAFVAGHNAVAFVAGHNLVAEAGTFLKQEKIHWSMDGADLFFAVMVGLIFLLIVVGAILSFV
jgi:hypothetical protein